MTRGGGLSLGGWCVDPHEGVWEVRVPITGLRPGSGGGRPTEWVKGGRKEAIVTGLGRVLGGGGGISVGGGLTS